MRHGASLIAALEGMSRPAFLIGRELAQNSRSGLTTRFLSKKLELPEEEIEYLVDVNHRLFFSDLTKVKLVPEGVTAIRRIAQGLQNRGDIPSLIRSVKALAPHDFRRLEEQIGVDKPGGKKAAAEELIARYYAHPLAAVEYVATRGFSPMAQEVFDALWQSKAGVMPVSVLRASFDAPDYAVERALLELVDGCALFEMFRFDPEDRLLRAVGLLSEIRQWREEAASAESGAKGLKTRRRKPACVDARELQFSDRVCRLVAAIAARPVRLRGDGDLFREDFRRLSEICPEDDEPSLHTCLWAAQGGGWLARVDNELCAGELEELIRLDPVSRHRILFEWLASHDNEAASRRTLIRFLDDLKPNAWHSVTEFVQHAVRAGSEGEQPVLKNVGGHWEYVSPSTAPSAARGLARSLEETFLWLGVVARAEDEDGSLFQVTHLGRSLLLGEEDAALAKAYPPLGAQLVVQPNFDIVVPSQDVDPLLTVPLDQFAERASTGQATVYHLSKESFTKAVQEGHDGGAFVAFLVAHERRGSLPGNVLTTLEDWRGGMKRVRLRTIHVLESGDPLVIADLMHRRKLSKYLSPLDPASMVAYKKIPKAELAKELEKQGFVVE